MERTPGPRKLPFSWYCLSRVEYPPLTNNTNMDYKMTFRLGAVITVGFLLQQVRSQDHVMARPERGGAVSGNTYCAPSFFNDGSAEHFIDGVVLGTISTTNTGFTSDANGWNDKFFDGTGTVSMLEKGGTFVVAITTGQATNSHYYGWIDLDRDETFEATEYIGHFQGTGSGVQGTLSFTVPANSSTGYTGLRILCSSELTANPDPCGGYAYGEAEDYAVLVAPPSPCAPVHTEGTTQGDFISVVLLDAAPVGLPGGAGQFPYRGINEVLHLAAGTAHDLAVVSGDYDADRYMAWVDWNADGDWDDAGELVGEVLATASNTAYLMDLNVPDNLWGWFTLRVRCADSNILAPCNDETYGETRDYMIVVDNPLLPCLTYNYAGSGTGLGIQHFDVNGSNGDVPHGHPNHWTLPLDPVVHVSPGDALDIAVTGMPGNEGNLVVCYVDLNNDLDFDDANETSDYVQGTSPDEVMNFTLGVPAGTVAGGHWVRIASYGQGFEFVNGCTDPVAGQVVDTYVIVDDPSGPCIPGFGSWTLDGHFIDGVQLGDIQNTGSGARFGQVYTDHPQSTTDLIVTHNHEITVTSGMQATSTYRAWIDYNNDLDFDDAGELLGSATSNAAYQELTILFTVPDGTPLGEKHLRVRCDFGAEPSACEDGQWGETEDYRVEIGGNTGMAVNADAGWSVQVVNGGDGIMVSHIVPNNSNALLTLLDVKGRLMQSAILDGARTVYPIHALSNGVYCVQIQEGGETFSSRFVIAR